MFLEPTFVDVAALPVAIRRQLIASLRGRASPGPTLFCPTGDRPGGGTFGLLLLAGLVIGAGLEVCFGGGEVAQAARGTALRTIWLVLLAAASGVAAATVATLARGLWARRRMPWPPGRYVLGAYLVDASSAVLRVESVLAVEATDVVHQHLEGEHVITTIAFRTRGHVYGFAVERREDALLALDQLEADLMALVDAVRYGEVDTIARLDPLFEARLVDAPLEPRAGAT